MKRALFGFLLTSTLVLLALPVLAEPKTAPETIVGNDLSSKQIQTILQGKKISCSDYSTRKRRVCRVRAYEYLSKKLSPEGNPWGGVEESALVVETVGKKDLILSAGVNWSIKQGNEEPIRARFRYLAQKLEKSLGPPMGTNLPPITLDGLEEYQQFTNGTLSATLILRKKGKGTKQKISVSVTFTDQATYRKFQP